MLCPDVESFEVLGGVARSKSNLQLSITATEKSISENTIKNALIIVSDISTVFEPKDYLNVGYE